MAYSIVFFLKFENFMWYIQINSLIFVEKVSQSGKMCGFFLIVDFDFPNNSGGLETWRNV
jgi:hypothetical protein